MILSPSTYHDIYGTLDLRNAAVTANSIYGILHFKYSENDFTIPLSTTYTINLNNINYNSTLQQRLNLIYPVGSIYTSMNNVSSDSLFGGTWTQITDRFLYCANSSGTTGGSKKISFNQLPAHTHSIYTYGGYYIVNDGPSGSGTWNTLKITSTEPTDNSLITGSTGGGQNYMPPYITVYCLY